MSVISPACLLELIENVVLRGVHPENLLGPLKNTPPGKFRFANYLSFPPELPVYLVDILFLTLSSAGLSACKIHQAIYINSRAKRTLDYTVGTQPFYAPRLKMLCPFLNISLRVRS